MEAAAKFLVILLCSCFCSGQLIFNGVPGANVTIVNNPCVCIVNGLCNKTSGTIMQIMTDGSGVIDFRVLNNPNIQQTTTPVPISATPASTGISTIVSSQTTCQAGLESCCLTSGYSCGLRMPPVQGAPTATTVQAPYGSYPWFALITQQSTNIVEGAGVLIDHMHVLTAAHKVIKYSSTPTAIKVRLGDWDLSTTTEVIPHMEFNVVKIFIHPSFNNNSLANGIAILRLSPFVPIGLIPTIAAACLPANPITSGRCWVAGYGQTNLQISSVSSILHHVELPLVDFATCQNLLKSTKLTTSFVLDPSFICAGGRSGRDACTGDGGSGLVCFSNSQWYVVGLTAWGIGCGSQNVPGVYINVQSFLSWIQNTTVLP